MLKEALRYFLVVALGLGLDVGLAWVLSHVFGLPLLLCAALGFLAGVAVNYLLFEMWVFATRRLSWVRLGKAYLAAQGALLARLVSVWLLAMLLPDMPQRQLAVLVIAAGLSFTVNFVLVRLMLRPR
ncbi:GtrA family protein [Novosphingobium sp.]|uniref:GtrA family protein n=1 Tax=Novosphingobium sp. TaxID=1874826 RepID=UPI00286E54FF|nr:GtrA family protein [Novosphingobium sp.]